MLGLGNFIYRAAVSLAEYLNQYSVEIGGTDEYIETPADNGLSINSSGGDRGWSMSLWLKCTKSGYIAVSMPEANHEWYLYVLSSGKAHFKIFGGNGSNAGIYQTLNVDTPLLAPADGSTSDWQHLVITFNLADADSSIIAYLNGAKKSHGSGATYSSSGTWADVTYTAGGGIRFGYGGGGYITIPNLDEVAFFDEVLTQSQVNDLYNSGDSGDVNGVSDYLLAWYRMGDGDTHPTISDNSGNGHDATMVNMESGDFKEEVPSS